MGFGREVVGPGHFGCRVAARESRERLLRDRTYKEEAYAEGLAMAYDEGLDYALS